MDEVIVTKYWMALVLGVMVLYVAIGLIGYRMKVRRESTDEKFSADL